VIPFARPLLEATYLRRENRFRSVVLLEGREVAVRVANTGRLAELLVAGRACFISPAATPERKTRFDLSLIMYEGTLVSLDTQLPNALFAEALACRQIILPGYAPGSYTLRREVPLGHSRIDFLLARDTVGPFWVEVKSASLVVDGVALFPDAITERGRRHLHELSAAAAAGDPAALVFIVQRCDATAVAPHTAADPAFATALTEARQAGVALLAYTCRVRVAGVEILQQIEVRAYGASGSRLTQRSSGASSNDAL
jgi:sugar fermentation stimulation protein A